MTMCPHGHGELDAAGNCPKQNLHVKARVGIACPLCGGPAHKRETDATTQQLQCAWRQYTRASGFSGMHPLDVVHAADFAAWLATGGRSYGREAQYKELAAQGVPLSPAMAKDAAKYTPAAPAVKAAPESATMMACVGCGSPGPLVGHSIPSGPLDHCAACQANPPVFTPIDNLLANPPTPITAPVALPSAPASEAPDERRERLRRALAS